MRKRISISLEQKIASILEREAVKRGTSISQLIAQHLEHYIALRERIFISLRERFTEQELKKLRKVSNELLEKPISKESVLYKLKDDKDLFKKIEKLSECEINMLLSYVENQLD